MGQLTVLTRPSRAWNSGWVPRVLSATGPLCARHHGSLCISDASVTSHGKAGNISGLAYPWDTLA